MFNDTVSQIYPTDKLNQKKIDQLLKDEGIRRDGNLDYTCGIFDEEGNLIATGSCFDNTLRCLAVSQHHQGEGLMNKLITHLTAIQLERGNTHIFLYTKCESAKFFQDLGYHEIVRVDQQIVFMENQKTGFQHYLRQLALSKVEANRVATLVMNANPFTLGHQYLVEKVAAECDVVHLFIVSEDSSLVPFNIREQLLRQGTAHLSNIYYHTTGPYIISNATFPSYFQKDDAAVIESQAKLDIAVFLEIAKTLGINCRYVGEEPTSFVTGIYNQIMQTELPKHHIECVVIPRKEHDHRAISASTVRQLIKEKRLDDIRPLVPHTTFDFFQSLEAQPIIQRIQRESNVIHY